MKEEIVYIVYPEAEPDRHKSKKLNLWERQYKSLKQIIVAHLLVIKLNFCYPNYMLCIIDKQSFLLSKHQDMRLFHHFISLCYVMRAYQIAITIDT